MSRITCIREILGKERDLCIITAIIQDGMNEIIKKTSGALKMVNINTSENFRDYDCLTIKITGYK